MTSCFSERDSFHGVWQADRENTASILSFFNFGDNSWQDDCMNLDSCKYELNFTEDTLTQNFEMFIDLYPCVFDSDENIMFELNVTCEVKYEYTHENELIKLKYVSQDFDLKDVSWSPLDEDFALSKSEEEINEIVKSMKKEMKEVWHKKESLGMQKDGTLNIKIFEDGRMELKDNDSIISNFFYVIKYVKGGERMDSSRVPRTFVRVK